MISSLDLPEDRFAYQSDQQEISRRDCTPCANRHCAVSKLYTYFTRG